MAQAPNYVGIADHRDRETKHAGKTIAGVFYPVSILADPKGNLVGTEDYKYRSVQSGNILYEGWSSTLTAAESAALWKIRRRITYGGYVYEDWASNTAEEDKIWNSYSTYFSPPPFINTHSVQFDGVNDHAIAADNAAYKFDYNQTFSMEIWFKTSLSGAIQGIFAKQLTTAAATGYFMSLETNGRVTFELRNQGAKRIEKSTTATSFNNGSWHQVVVTYSGSGTAAGLKIYVDGAVQTTTTGADTLGGLTTLSTASLIIGANRNATSQSFRGNLNQFRIWDVELSAANVTTLYDAAKPTDSSTVQGASRRAAWPLGTGDTYPNLADPISLQNLVMTNMTAGDIETAVP